MSKKKPTYTEEFKREAVELLLTSGKTIDELAKDLGVSRPSLSNWKRDFGGKARKPRGSRKKSEMEIELDQIKKEVVILKKERDILKKAAAFFAKESL